MGDGFVALAPARPREALAGTAAAWVTSTLVVALVAGLAVATADVRVARERPAVRHDLNAAEHAAAAVPAALSGSGPAVGGGPPPRSTLAVLAGSGKRAAHEAGRARWGVAARVGVDPGGVTALRRDAGRMGTLAQAAAPLRNVITVLDGGDTDPDRLDDLARGVSRYTTAAVRVNAPGVPALRRASLATGLLAGLSGGHRPRTWALCPPGGRCTLLTLTEGKVTRRRRGERSSSSIEVVVRGGTAPGSESMLFGDPEPGAGQRFDVPAVYRLLLEQARGVSSSDPEEQAALDQLGS